MSSGGIGNAVSSVLSFTIIGKLFETKAPKPTTQRIGELAQQTAKEGEPRPIVWGRVRPISGNIMHSSAPRIITREVQGQSSGGGKGGKKKEPKQYEERVFRTYAIRICEGPITAIIRIWRNNKLVYDARGNAWGAQNNGVFLGRARFYLGGWAQMPDPTLESQWGAGNVPAYRGTCYMVVPDEDLTELGGAIPQYIYEVERAEGTYNTSLPYNIECVETGKSNGGMNADGKIYAPEISNLIESVESVGGGILAGEFRDNVIEIAPDAESVNSGAGSVEAGVFRVGLINYTNYPIESVNSGAGSVEAGVFRVGLINYTNYPIESVNQLGGSISDGSHG